MPVDTITAVRNKHIFNIVNRDYPVGIAHRMPRVHALEGQDGIQDILRVDIIEHFLNKIISCDPEVTKVIITNIPPHDRRKCQLLQLHLQFVQSWNLFSTGSQQNTLLILIHDLTELCNVVHRFTDRKNKEVKLTLRVIIKNNILKP